MLYVDDYLMILPQSHSVSPLQDYNAKLSDFGLARTGPSGDQTHVSTRVMGTYGYAAPEYVMTGEQWNLPVFLECQPVHSWVHLMFLSMNMHIIVADIMYVKLLL